jgi:hypothetical protein
MKVSDRLESPKKQAFLWLFDHGLTEADLSEWGIIIQNDGSLHIPIRAEDGEELFTLTRKFEGVKYDFSPGCRHGFALYGIDRAALEIKWGGGFIVVEGFSDCIALHKAGYKYTVSTLTTHITRTQLAMLKDMAKGGTIWLDGDKAGVDQAIKLNNTLKDLPHLEYTNILTVDGYDPASLYAELGERAIDRVYFDELGPFCGRPGYVRLKHDLSFESFVETKR